jgi:hypothetical protein
LISGNIKRQSSGPLGAMLMPFTSLSLLDLLARDERGTSVRRPTRLLGARWLSMRNGIAGGECHVDGGIVLFLLRVLAHGHFLLHVIKTLEHKLKFPHQVRNRTFAAPTYSEVKRALWPGLFKPRRVRR